MKKKSSILLVLILFSTLPIFIPVVASFSAPAFHGTGVVKTQLFSSFEATAVADGELEELTPFWVDMVDAEKVKADGEGVYIAVLDTGLLSNWEFLFSEANIRDDLGIGFTHDVWYDEDINDFVFGPLRDDRGFITDDFMGSGHGSHVTGIITGYQYAGSLGNFWIRGVAPKAQIIPVLVLDAWIVDTLDGNSAGLAGGTDEMVAAGIMYVAELSKHLDGPVIISMSLGGPEPAPEIEAAINYAIKKGVIVIASAGNEGEAGMGWPGAYDQVISVAAGGWTEQWLEDDKAPRWWLRDVPENLHKKDYWGNRWQIYLEDFSSRPNKDLGQKFWDLDVTAPGSSVVGPYKHYFTPLEGGFGYYYVWGTSQAAPHVSGIASMILQNCHFRCCQKYNQFVMENILKLAALRNNMYWGEAYVYDPFYADDPGVIPWHFTWEWNDYGTGFLQADVALKISRFYCHYFGRGHAHGYAYCNPCCH